MVIKVSEGRKPLIRKTSKESKSVNVPPSSFLDKGWKVIHAVDDNYRVFVKRDEDGDDRYMAQKVTGGEPFEITRAQAKGYVPIVYPRKKLPFLSR